MATLAVTRRNHVFSDRMAASPIPEKLSNVYIGRKASKEYRLDAHNFDFCLSRLCEEVPYFLLHRYWTMRTRGRLAAFVLPLTRLTGDNIFRHKTSCHGQCFQNNVIHPPSRGIPSDHCRTVSSMMIPCNTMDYLTLDIMAVPSFVSMSQDCLYSDPALQAELFNGIAHVFLDIVGLMSPAQPILRLSILVGRIFAFLSDYVPDHFMYPIEWAFEIITILFSAALFVQSCRPLLPLVKINLPYSPSSAESDGSNKTSFRDLRAYQVLFRQFDMSWLQFKALTAEAVEWVEIEPHAQIRSAQNYNSRESVKEDFIYWLHQGDLRVYYTNSSNMQHINSRHVPPEARLVGELGFSRHLLRRASDTRRGIRWPFETGTSHHELNCNENGEECDIEAGPLGATILRISTSRLLELMEYDEQLEASIQRMIATGMQEKLCVLLKGQIDQPNNSSIMTNTICSEE